MADSTVHAEALIAAVARAFYEDDAVCLIDVLLRDKFLRDDDMGPRLSLPAKQLRRTMQMLQDEHLVKYELVDDLSQGGSQATKFWYVDYNHAVNVIRLRIYLLKKRLEEAELRARSSSMYLCPGYRTGACNGRYTETEAQQVVDAETGLFLCQECYRSNANNPDPPPLQTYTLQLVDNTKALKAAMDNMRRLNTQLGTKTIGTQRLRVGIYDLLQKVRQTRGPLSSNLPSENRALGIGSKRLAGTGRTAGIKAKKAAQKGIGFGRTGVQGAVKRTEEGSDLTFLKNAMGEEIAFYVEKGGGSKANLLAKSSRHRSSELMDAASKFSRKLGDDRDARERKKAKTERAKKRAAQPETLSFLEDNIGSGKQAAVSKDAEDDSSDEDSDDEVQITPGPAAQLQNMTEEERQALFQSQYLAEVARQRSLMKALKASENGLPAKVVSDDKGVEENVPWEDG